MCAVCVWGSSHSNPLRIVTGVLSLRWRCPKYLCYWLVFLCPLWLPRLLDLKALCNLLSKWFICPVKYHRGFVNQLCIFLEYKSDRVSLSFLLGQAVNATGWSVCLVMTGWVFEEKQSGNEQSWHCMDRLFTDLGSLLRYSTIRVS